MNSCNKCVKQNTCTKAKSIENYSLSGCSDFLPFGALVCDNSYKRKREFGEPIRMYLVEEDTLVKLLEEQHRLHCGDRSTFEYFWDMMVESGLDQHVSHREFVEAVEYMTFEKLAEMDLALYTEHIPSDEVVHASWVGMDGDQCSNCGRSLRDLMDADSYYSSEFENAGFDKLKACPFCGARMKK